MMLYLKPLFELNKIDNRSFNSVIEISKLGGHNESFYENIFNNVVVLNGPIKLLMLELNNFFQFFKV
jgi:hypothetical protein